MSEDALRRALADLLDTFADWYGEPSANTTVAAHQKAGRAALSEGQAPEPAKPSLAERCLRIIASGECRDPVAAACLAVDGIEAQRDPAVVAGKQALEPGALRGDAARRAYWLENRRREAIGDPALDWESYWLGWTAAPQQALSPPVRDPAGMEAARAKAIEDCAQIAAAHRAKPLDKTSRRFATEEALASIADEARGEEIAAEMPVVTPERLILEWVSVDARLPDDDRMVLVAYHKPYHSGRQNRLLHVTMPARHSGGEWRFMVENYKRAGDPDRISHWMEIPAPPKRAARSAPPIGTGGGSAEGVGETQRVGAAEAETCCCKAWCEAPEAPHCNRARAERESGSGRSTTGDRE